MDNSLKVRFFNPALNYQKHKVEIDSEIQRVLSAGDLILRKDVETFEQILANFVGTKYAVGLNSGTDALYLALVAAGIKPGDEVLLPSHTFVATAQVVAQMGAVPVLYDLDGILNFGEKTKAVMMAHIAGEFASPIMEELINITNTKGIVLIEDACQALGAVQNGKKAGSFGIAGCFSFYPAKILGAYGDAGALVTNDEALAEEVRELRNHYKKDYSKWGINSRLDNIQAAILNVKIKYLTEALALRKSIATQYLRAFKDIPGLELPRTTEGRVWQDFVVRTAKRDELYSFLKGKGIETMKNEYPFPIPKLPQSLEYEAQTLRLPCNELLSDEEVLYIIDSVKEFYA